MKFTVLTAAFLSSVWSIGGAEAKVGPTFFLIDTTDQLCLAGDEFKRCSIETLWYVTGDDGKKDIVVVSTNDGVD